MKKKPFKLVSEIPPYRKKKKDKRHQSKQNRMKPLYITNEPQFDGFNQQKCN